MTMIAVVVDLILQGFTPGKGGEKHHQRSETFEIMISGYFCPFFFIS